MSEVVLYIIFMFVYVIAGGLNIGNAVTDFKAKHYVRFGFDVMFAISMVMCMANLVFSV